MTANAPKTVAPHFNEQLQKLVDSGAGIDSQALIERWVHRVLHFLKEARGVSEAIAFGSLGKVPYSFEELGSMLGHLEGLIAREVSSQLTSLSAGDVGNRPTSSGAAGEDRDATDSSKVFLVHGHDDPAKEALARFLERIGLHPIILHEHANEGRTIIEKFEVYSRDVAFAVVLLTPDDVVAATQDGLEPKRRARQNVVLELGYFMGRLGRARVCALFKRGVELPSDYQGILYIEFDSDSAWKLKLAQELANAKLPIEIAKVVLN